MGDREKSVTACGIVTPPPRRYRTGNQNARVRRVDHLNRFLARALKSVEELKQAWVSRGYVSLLEGLTRTYGKPLMFTEIGYGSVAGANMAPATTDGGSLDLQEQANAYEAALATFWGKPWMAGMYWWDWSVDPNKGGSGDSSFTPHNKPAEAVLKSYYTGR